MEKMTKVKRKEIEKEIEKINEELPYATVDSINYKLVKGSPEHTKLRKRVHDLYNRRKELQDVLGGKNIIDEATISAAIEDGEKKRKEKKEKKERVKKISSIKG